MKVPQLIKSMKPVEMVALGLFVLYLILPISMPRMAASAIDSPLGMVGLFVIVLYLFFYTNPILAIIFVFVAYELLRRSSSITGRVAMVQYTPSQIRKDAQMQEMNPVQTRTLEEDVVDKMAPIGRSDPAVYMSSTFKPVSDPVGTASLY